MMTNDDIIKNGKTAEELLKKYPYVAVKEREFYRNTAVIGRLVASRYISFVNPVTDDLTDAIIELIEKDIRRE